MKTKKHKASVLIMSMIVLSMILITTLTITLATLRGKKISIGSSKSTIAYQNAETGVERVMERLASGEYSTLGEFCDESSALLSGANYEAELKKEDGSIVNCGGSFDSLKIAEVTTIKSTGWDPGKQANRAIEAAVAATSLIWHPLNLSNSWTNYGGSYVTAKYAKDNRTGLVYLQGTIKSGNCSDTNNTCTIANSNALPSSPSNYQPAGAISFSQPGKTSDSGSLASFRIDVLSNGSIRVVKATSTSTTKFPTDYVSLDGIVFQAE